MRMIPASDRSESSIQHWKLFWNIQSSYVVTITENEFDDIYNNHFHNRKQNFANLIKHLALEKVDAFQNAYIVLSKYKTNKDKAHKWYQ